jgi:hypothetical protein
VRVEKASEQMYDEAGCYVLSEAGCHETRGRCLPKTGAGVHDTLFYSKQKRLLTFSFTAWLSSDSLGGACKETVHKEERETGLEPATACLEGRVVLNHRLLPMKRLHKGL